MKNIAAYALLVLGGKSEPSESDVQKLLKEAGVKAEDEKVQTLVKALGGTPFHELVESGKSKIATSGTVSGGSGGPAPGPDGGAEKKEEKVEEKVEEEADVDMGGLFGDDY